MPSIPIADIRNSFGAAFVGLLINTALFGFTIVQTWLYFWKYRNKDPKLLQFFISFITFIDTLHTLTCAYAIHWYLVRNIGNVENLEDSMWALNVQIILQIVIGASVQLFVLCALTLTRYPNSLFVLTCRSHYARRVHLMSQRLICPILITVLVITGCATGIFFAAKHWQFSWNRFASEHSLVWTTYVLLGTVVLGDILVAVSMCQYLYHKRTGFVRADSVLVFLMAYSINSGLLTGLLGVATTIAFIVSPSSLIWLGCSWAMSKCYVNSLLARLNIREYLRDRSTPGELDNAHNLSIIRVGSEAGILFVSIEDSTANVPPQPRTYQN
ncbi:hypothetical protein EDB83DRAFT_2561018 [Lactarius deliciosus]|nr:hypothetical protein EDB83DRAFT_2561018 [Lactarius deliciosus]